MYTLSAKENNGLFNPSTLEKQQNSASAQQVREEVKMSELGISYPTLMDIPLVLPTEIINPRVILQMLIRERQEQLQRGPGAANRTGSGLSTSRGGNRAGGGSAGNRDFQSLSQSFLNPFGSSGDLSQNRLFRQFAQEMNASDKVLLRRFDFVIQFAWVETPPSARDKVKEAARLAALAAQGDSPAATSALDGETLENEPTP